MPLVRIFLFTYRRPLLLARALGSLRAQTFKDWVCEVHNDAPDDDSPRTVVEKLTGNDPRFTYHRHPKNLGPVASFNLAFATIAAPYVSILEDDNWWEPPLLQTLLAHLQKEPSASVAWANLRLHQEQSDGSWTDTGRTVWPAGSGARRFDGPVLLQAFDALHSNGAMLCRSGRHEPVPSDTPFAHIESVRERSFRGPLLLEQAPLGHLALTRRTARSPERRLWLQGQMHLAASFLQNVPLAPATWDRLWHHLRSTRPRNTSLLLLLALAGVASAPILNRSRPLDWLRLAAAFIRRPLLPLSALRFRSAQPGLWRWLNQRTTQRVSEASSQGFESIHEDSLLQKE